MISIEELQNRKGSLCDLNTEMKYCAGAC